MAAAETALYDEIKLGIDWHADHYRVSRMIDGTPPQPAQRFDPKAFLAFAQAQCGLAKKVYSCYEAGPGAYVLHRQPPWGSAPQLPGAMYATLTKIAGPK